MESVLVDKWTIENPASDWLHHKKTISNSF